MMPTTIDQYVDAYLTCVEGYLDRLPEDSSFRSYDRKSGKLHDRKGGKPNDSERDKPKKSFLESARDHWSSYWGETLPPIRGINNLLDSIDPQAPLASQTLATNIKTALTQLSLENLDPIRKAALEDLKLRVFYAALGELIRQAHSEQPLPKQDFKKVFRFFKSMSPHSIVEWIDAILKLKAKYLNAAPQEQGQLFVNALNKVGLTDDNLKAMRAEAAKMDCNIRIGRPWGFSLKTLGWGGSVGVIAGVVTLVLCAGTAWCSFAALGAMLLGFAVAVGVDRLKNAYQKRQARQKLQNLEKEEKGQERGEEGEHSEARLQVLPGIFFGERAVLSVEHRSAAGAGAKPEGSDLQQQSQDDQHELLLSPRRTTRLDEAGQVDALNGQSQQQQASRAPGCGW